MPANPVINLHFFCLPLIRLDTILVLKRYGVFLPTVNQHIVMRLFLIIVFSILAVKVYSQEYSHQKVHILIDSLTSISTKFDNRSVIGMDGDEPIIVEDTLYKVYDNWTGLTIYRNANYIDNDVHKVFHKIVKKGKSQDFIHMTKSDFPNIRVYGYWALKQSKSKDTDKVSSILSDDTDSVQFITVGDTLLGYKVNEIIKILN